MSKIVITGHTGPVGKILSEYFSKEYEVIGISRSTGYDLSNADDRSKIIEIANDADHFINLANVGCSQSYILLGLYNAWSQRSGKIISFSSIAAALPLELLYGHSASLEMIASKFLLEQTHKELSMKKLFGNQPQSVLVRFMNFDPKEGSRAWEPYTDKQQMIDMVDFILKSDSYISTLDFRQILPIDKQS